ncbi:MAG: D-alanine--D-alanine ligase [Oscillospiraceae bacterium]|nr:D-alanine--D-alanine ligase [Oscillospiraceae bacterium]
MRIVVLCGGLYPERDVSISSGRQIAATLIERGHDILLMDLFFGYPESNPDPQTVFNGDLTRVPDRLGAAAPDLAAVRAMRPGRDTGPIGPRVFELCSAADIVFLALHGEDGENGTLQAAFDLAGIRYTGTGVLGSALAMHKGVSRNLFEGVGIQVPHGRVVSRDGRDVLGAVRFPCIVKPCSGGSSVATTIVTSPGDLDAALEQVFRVDHEALIEDYIVGREFSVGILDGEALPAIEVRPKHGFFNYENKYQAGMTEEICPADLSEADETRLRQAARTVHGALRLEVYSRTDFILTEGGDLYCLETNTLPGMTPQSLLPREAQAVGLDFGDLCERIIAVSMEKYQ